MATRKSSPISKVPTKVVRTLRVRRVGQASCMDAGPLHALGLRSPSFTFYSPRSDKNFSVCDRESWQRDKLTDSMEKSPRRYLCVAKASKIARATSSSLHPESAAISSGISKGMVMRLSRVPPLEPRELSKVRVQADPGAAMIHGKSSMMSISHEFSGGVCCPAAALKSRPVTGTREDGYGFRMGKQGGAIVEGLVKRRGKAVVVTNVRGDANNSRKDQRTHAHVRLVNISMSHPLTTTLVIDVIVPKRSQANIDIRQKHRGEFSPRPQGGDRTIAPIHRHSNWPLLQATLCQREPSPSKKRCTLATPEARVLQVLRCSSSSPNAGHRPATRSASCAAAVHNASLLPAKNQVVLRLFSSYV